MISMIVAVVSVAVLLFLLIFVGAATNKNTGFSAYTGETINWDTIADDELQSYLPNNKINAIKRYRELTGAGLKEAKAAVEYAMAHPNSAKKGRSGLEADTGGAGVQDLIAEGRIAEAASVYAAFMGVDEFTAKAAVTELEQQLTEYRGGRR